MVGICDEYRLTPTPRTPRGTSWRRSCPGSRWLRHVPGRDSRTSRDRTVGVVAHAATSLGLVLLACLRGPDVPRLINGGRGKQELGRRGVSRCVRPQHELRSVTPTPDGAVPSAALSGVTSPRAPKTSRPWCPSAPSRYSGTLARPPHRSPRSTGQPQPAARGCGRLKVWTNEHVREPVARACTRSLRRSAPRLDGGVASTAAGSARPGQRQPPVLRTPVATAMPAAGSRSLLPPPTEHSRRCPAHVVVHRVQPPPCRRTRVGAVPAARGVRRVGDSERPHARRDLDPARRPSPHRGDRRRSAPTLTLQRPGGGRPSEAAVDGMAGKAARPSATPEADPAHDRRRISLLVLARTKLAWAAIGHRVDSSRGRLARNSYDAASASER